MRVINADALRDEFDPDDKTDFDATGIRYYIASAPTIDAVPVVRCGECKHWKRYKPNSEYGDCNQWRQGNDENAETSADDFCSHGAKMDKEE